MKWAHASSLDVQPLLLEELREEAEENGVCATQLLGYLLHKENYIGNRKTAMWDCGCLTNLQWSTSFLRTKDYIFSPHTILEELDIPISSMT